MLFISKLCGVLWAKMKNREKLQDGVRNGPLSLPMRAWFFREGTPANQIHDQCERREDREGCGAGGGVVATSQHRHPDDFWLSHPKFQNPHSWSTCPRINLEQKNDALRTCCFRQFSSHIASLLAFASTSPQSTFVFACEASEQASKGTKYQPRACCKSSAISHVLDVLLCWACVRCASGREA